jgi:hypothetical protein
MDVVTRQPIAPNGGDRSPGGRRRKPPSVTADGGASRRIADYALLVYSSFVAAECHRTASSGAVSRSSPAAGSARICKRRTLSS